MRPETTWWISLANDKGRFPHYSQLAQRNPRMATGR
jgi:hypothetical protein